jgi:uncharacterized Ntn-hydrolase superfamily protein
VTYSVVARDPATGELGVAVASCVLAVGRAAPWARAGVGAVVTQSHTRRGYGPHGLAGLDAGLHPADVLGTLLARDAGADGRQVALVDATGAVAAHTGEKCLPVCGHRSGDGWTVQGNMLAGENVLPSMASALAGAADLPLAERLLAALRAGQATGGDLRGQQSSALLVVGAQRTEEPWEAVTVDLRVDDQPEPLAELTRLLQLQRAYETHDVAALALMGPAGPRSLHAALEAARRGDLDAARAALGDLRRRPGWESWLRANGQSSGLRRLVDLLDV